MNTPEEPPGRSRGRTEPQALPSQDLLPKCPLSCLWCIAALGPLRDDVPACIWPLWWSTMSVTVVRGCVSRGVLGTPVAACRSAVRPSPAQGPFLRLSRAAVNVLVHLCGLYPAMCGRQPPTPRLPRLVPCTCSQLCAQGHRAESRHGPYWESLYHRNWQMPPLRACLSPKSWWVGIYQPPTGDTPKRGLLAHWVCLAPTAAQFSKPLVPIGTPPQQRVRV